MVAVVVFRLTVHNISKDPLGWDGNTTISMESDFLEYLTRIIDLNKKCAVVIDSISNLILHRGASYTCRVLHKCSTLQHQKGMIMFSLIHTPFLHIIMKMQISIKYREYSLHNGFTSL